MFDWDDLKHFLAVARHGSRTAGARPGCRRFLGSWRRSCKRCD
ncbi:MAG: LysR family transcriptional regulator [Polaromonas sp.]|nr:LysR family transcriptional regulator [Polaromonas sp.]